LAQEVAQDGPKRLPARSSGYYFEHDVDNAPAQELRAAMLEYITEEHPQVVSALFELAPLMARVNAAHAERTLAAGQKYYDITSSDLKTAAAEAAALRQLQVTVPHDLADAAVLHAKLASWAETYNLEAPWVMESAVHSLVHMPEPPALKLAGAMFELGAPLRLSFQPRPLGSTEGLEAYRKRLYDSFRHALTEHMKALTALLNSTPHLMPAGAVDRRTRQALSSAVEWQVTGQISGGDPRTIQRLLDRVGLVSRSPLKV